MGQASISSEALKRAIKEALIETLHEERELLRGVFIDALEEIALVEAIERGRETEMVDREQVLQLLKGAA